MEGVVDFLCPISREVYEFPMICQDGFTYEKSFIDKWLTKNDISPMIGSQLPSKKILENKVMNVLVSTQKAMRARFALLKRVEKKPTKKEQKEIPEEIKDKFDSALEHYYKASMDLVDCVSQMKEVYEKAPFHFDIIMNYANVLRFSGQFDQALSLIKLLKEIRPQSLIPRYIKVRVISEKGEKDKAQKKLLKVFNSFPIEDHLLLETRFLSYSILSTGNRDRAKKTIISYISVVPNDPRALSHQIYLNLLQEHYSEVIILCQEYLKVYANDVSILFHLAKAYAHEKQKTKSFEIYSLIDSISKDKAVKAKALYESAVNRNPVTEFEKMVEELEKSYANDPKEEADGYLAALYADRKEYDKAEEWINKCAERVDINDDYVYLGIKAQIEENKNNFDIAIAHYIRLSELDPSNGKFYNDRIDNILKNAAESSEKKD